jgi:4-diphosphocytidyl-2-C-methyl-D-erythritol kinase
LAAANSILVWSASAALPAVGAGLQIGKLRMHVRRTAAEIEVHTPAKLNLFLEVLARRPDGYHEIETLMTPVAICDTLTFVPLDEPVLELECRWALGLAARNRAGHNAAARRLQTLNSDSGDDSSDDFGELPAGPDNLAWKAVKLMRDQSGTYRGARISLVKRIPAAAGLGGASSDAAAALVAANLAWNLNWPRERLIEMAAGLGSDVPFFLGHDTAMCCGRGERIEPVRGNRLHVVVVRPAVGLSTPDVYRRCRPASAPISAQSLREALECGNAARAGQALVNRLEQSAAELTPWIGRLREEFARQGCLGHQMSGSGSSYFGICRSARHARGVASRLRARQAGTVYAAATAGSKPAAMSA